MGRGLRRKRRGNERKKVSWYSRHGLGTIRIARGVGVNSVCLTTCAGMTCHARREHIVSPENGSIFSVLSIYSSTTRAKRKQIVNLLLLDHFYPSDRRIDEFKGKATNHCILVRSLVMVRSQLPAQRG